MSKLTKTKKERKTRIEVSIQKTIASNEAHRVNKINTYLTASVRAQY